MADLGRGHHCIGSSACDSGRTRHKVTRLAGEIKVKHSMVLVSTEPNMECNPSEGSKARRISVEETKRGRVKSGLGGSYCDGNALSLRRRVRVQLVRHGECPRVVRGQWEAPLRGRGEIQWVGTAISSSVVGAAVTGLGHHCSVASQSILPCLCFFLLSRMLQCQACAVCCGYRRPV
jgi:hypothetical protein